MKEIQEKATTVEGGKATKMEIKEEQRREDEEGRKEEKVVATAAKEEGGGNEGEEKESSGEKEWEMVSPPSSPPVLVHDSSSHGGSLVAIGDHLSHIPGVKIKATTGVAGVSLKDSLAREIASGDCGEYGVEATKVKEEGEEGEEEGDENELLVGFSTDSIDDRIGDDEEGSIDGGAARGGVGGGKEGAVEDGEDEVEEVGAVGYGEIDDGFERGSSSTSGGDGHGNDNDNDNGDGDGDAPLGSLGSLASLGESRGPPWRPSRGPNVAAHASRDIVVLVARCASVRARGTRRGMLTLTQRCLYFEPDMPSTLSLGSSTSSSSSTPSEDLDADLDDDEGEGEGYRSGQRRPPRPARRCQWRLGLVSALYLRRCGLRDSAFEFLTAEGGGRSYFFNVLSPESTESSESSADRTGSSADGKGGKIGKSGTGAPPPPWTAKQLQTRRDDIVAAMGGRLSNRAVVQKAGTPSGVMLAGVCYYIFQSIFSLYSVYIQSIFSVKVSR